MTDRATTLLSGRRDRLERILGQPLRTPGAGSVGPLSAQNRVYLLEEAQDLYWNELAWENLTDEEALEQGPLTELIFPGLLAFVRGLLLQEVMPDALAPASPRPQVVEDILLFLTGRVVELEEAVADPGEAEPTHVRAELELTNHLVDLVLYRFHGLRPSQVERVEADRHASA